MIAKGLVTAVLLVAAGSAAAECSRADVDHYLDRGFTPDQVVALCGAAAPTPGQDAGGDLAVELRDAIAAMDVALDATGLSYTTELCVHYGPPNLAEQRKKACGLAHYRIARAGLAVDSSRRRLLFWGRNAVAVRGAIERRYELGQEVLPADDARRLAEELEQGDRTEVPVREGIALERVKEMLGRIAQ